MANLMGLLLSASPARLTALAQAWQIADEPEPSSLVARLYSEMTDEYAVKCLLEQIAPPGKITLERLVGAHKGWMRLSDLRASLPFSEDYIEHMLAGLSELGLISIEVVRVAGGEVLDGPPYFHRDRASELATIARVPPDLLHVLRRIKQQMAAGDQSEKRLRKLLGELEMPQLQYLCDRWQLPIAQQCFKRELMVQLETAIGQQELVQATLRRLGDDAELIFRCVRLAKGRLPLSRLRQSVALDEPSFRKAIRALLSVFLLQETYVGNERYVFIPAGVGTDDGGLALKSRRCVPLESPMPDRVLSADHCFFFDLLALLNYCQPRRIELYEQKIPRRIAAELREQLTIGGRDGQGALRLEYLLHISKRLGLLAVEDGKLYVDQAVKRWAELSISDQAERLFAIWLDDDDWKGPGGGVQRPGVEVCRTMRRLLVQCLNECQPGRWYSLASVVDYVAANLKESLQCSAASETDDASQPPGCCRSDIHVQIANIVRLFHWMSLLCLGLGNGDALSAIQISPLGAWVFGCDGAARPEPRRAKIVVGANFEVTITEPDTLAWYNVLKIALTVSVGRISVHQITKRKVQLAALSGESADELLDFLRERTLDNLPNNVIAAIKEWAATAKAELRLDHGLQSDSFSNFPR